MTSTKRGPRTAAVLLLAGLSAIGGCSMSGEAGPHASREESGPTRGGASPASSVIPGRADGGTDARRAPGGALRYTLAYPTGARNSSVLMLEADGPEQVRVGQPFSYTLRISNLTDTPLHGVSVYDMSTDLSPRSPGARPAADREDRDEDAPRTSTPRVQASAWNVGSLGPKETKTKQVNGVADEVGTLNRCLGVTYTPTLCTSIAVVKPELQITKEGPSDALVCQGITYRYVVTNTGTGTANGVRVEDALPEGLTTAEGNRAVSADVGDLRQGESKEVRVPVKAARTGRFSSRATARSGDVQSQSREVATVLREPVLAVSVEAPEARYANEAVDFRITVRNTGDAPAQRAVVRLSSPGGDRFADRDLGTIEPGTSRSIPVSTRAGNQAGDLRLVATAEATCARPVSDQGSVAIRTIPALLLECVDSIDPVRVGGTTVYTLTVMNQGSGPDTNVAVKVTVPAEEQYVDGNGSTPIHAEGQTLTFAPIPTLAPKQVVQWKFQVKGVKAGDARLNAELTSNSLTRPATKSESTRVVDDAAAPVNNK